MTSEPPSLTVDVDDRLSVVGADEQGDVEIDVGRWCRLAATVLDDAGRRGELTLTFVDRHDIAELNEEHLGGSGPTDVLSFPLDATDDQPPGVGPDNGIPLLLGDVVICPDVARAQASTHAGSLDDELALLVVHGVLHVLGHDHADPDEAAVMRRKERQLLADHHWGGPPPSSFRQEHDQP